jgi:phosphate transport system permease protein
VPLVSLLTYTIKRGVSAMSVDFFVHNPTGTTGVPGGGVANALVGTAIIMGIAIVLAMPLGLFVALFLRERPGPLSSLVRYIADVMSGLPSIAIGMFAYAIIVVPTGHASGISASVALAVLMLPIVVRADEAALRTVPLDLWEAGIALGARRSAVARRVVVRGALSSLVTGNLLAIARAVGETAPLLFTTVGAIALTVAPLQQMNAMPLEIFNDGTQPYPDLQTMAWGSAMVLLGIVLVLSIAARLVASRLTRNAR